MIEALAVLGGYLLGSMPFGYWLPRLLRGEDIRARGSGNIGASNVFRVYGRRIGIAVAFLDLAKGFAAALLGHLGRRRAGRRPRRRRRDGRSRAAGLPALREGREDGRDRGRSVPRARAARHALLRRGLARRLLLTRYASVASIVTALALVGFVLLFGSDWPVVAFAAAGRGRDRLPPPPQPPPPRRRHRAPLRAATARAARLDASSGRSQLGERRLARARRARVPARRGARRRCRSARRRRRACGWSRS